METTQNPAPESIATPEDFRERLIEFRGGVYDFFVKVADKHSAKGIDRFSSAVAEFDERLFYMATGLSADVDSGTIGRLIHEIDVRQDVIINHFDNPDTVKDEYSLEKMIPRATNFIKAAMIGSRALTDEAKEELNKLDSKNLND